MPIRENNKTDNFKEIGIRLDSIMTGGILGNPVLKEIAHRKVPLTHKKAERVGKAVTDAVKAALEPGAVVRVSFDSVPEIHLASEVCQHILPKFETLNPVEVQDQGAHFELGNGSAIFLSPKLKGD